FAVSASATSAGAASGFASRYSAATPATCGVAMDVPEIVLAASSPSIQAEVISWPGARMSTQSPQLDHGGGTSSESVAPTVIVLGSEAGEMSQASEPSLPAATAKVTPASMASATTSLSAWLKVPPRLMFATEGPEAFSAIQSMPAMMPA